MPDGRRLGHPAQVARGDFLEFDHGLYYVAVAGVGTVRVSGRGIVLAVLTAVRP